MTLTPGTRLNRYEILSKLGEGGMGEVFLAEDTSLRRKIAIKILQSAFTKMVVFETKAMTSTFAPAPHIQTMATPTGI